MSKEVSELNLLGKIEYIPLALFGAAGFCFATAIGIGIYLWNLPPINLLLPQTVVDREQLGRMLIGSYQSRFEFLFLFFLLLGLAFVVLIHRRKFVKTINTGLLGLYGKIVSACCIFAAAAYLNLFYLWTTSAPYSVAAIASFLPVLPLHLMGLYNIDTTCIFVLILILIFSSIAFGVLRGMQIAGFTLLPLPIEIYFYSNGMFNVPVISYFGNLGNFNFVWIVKILTAKAFFLRFNLDWITNAFVLYVCVASLVFTFTLQFFLKRIRYVEQN